jgi:TolB-like protein
MPNKLSQFWQELKRRNVTRVLAVYIAAAFMLLELISMFSEQIGLPDGTWKVAFIISLAGLVIAAIVSWVYDIHPEGGIVKTEPVKEDKLKGTTSASNSWKIASYISFVVIVGLIILNVIPRSNINRKLLEKSIAVLPLDYLSEDPNKEYLANGVLDAITGNLSKIEGLRVMPRTSVEQYRDSNKSAKEIGEELDVSYLIEGSFQMVNDQVKLIIQLVVAEEGDHIYFNEYDRDYSDIFAVQSEVAQSIVKEIEIALTPEEIQRIEKIPTTSLTAYDFYQRGTEKLYDWWSERDSVALVDSEIFFRKALDYDSTYALAYARLAWIYGTKSRQAGDYLSDNYLDSTIILADKALSFDNQLAEAYDAKGDALFTLGNTELGIKDLEKAINYNPNFFEPYMTLGVAYMSLEKIDLAIHYLYQASILHRGELLPYLFRLLAFSYVGIGYPERARYYNLEALQLDRDTMQHFYFAAVIEAGNENYKDAIRYLEDAYAIDTNSAYRNIFQQIAYNNLWLGRFEEALEYYKKYEAETKDMGLPLEGQLHRIGYVYWQLGMKSEANFYFNEEIILQNKFIELERPRSQNLYSYYDLAGIYAFLGEKDKAFENLRIFNQKKTIPKWMVTLINNDPLFNSIRDEAEFQQIVRDIEAKYQSEHERVRQWLEENDML